MPLRTQINFAEPPNNEGKTTRAIVFVIAPGDNHPAIDMQKEYSLTEIATLFTGKKK